MPMHIEIKINDKTIYTVKVSNLGGKIDGMCMYIIESKTIDNEYVHVVDHDRRDGALVLALKALHELDLDEKRDD